MGRSIGAMHDRASEGDAEGRVRRVWPVMCARPVWSVFAACVSGGATRVCQEGPSFSRVWHECHGIRTA